MSDRQFSFALTEEESQCLFSVLNSYSCKQLSSIADCLVAKHEDPSKLLQVNAEIEWHVKHKIWFHEIMEKMGYRDTISKETNERLKKKYGIS